MTSVEYYSIRRLSPYMGVIQVIDLGTVRAYSTDGRKWRPRRLGEEERERAQPDIEAPDSAEVLRHALRERPSIPFPPGDRYELWLLHRETRMPLALLRTEHWAHNMVEIPNPSWRPFLWGDHSFMPTDPGKLGGIGPRYREALERQVDFAARPQPAAQWFERHADGSGTGLLGLRVEASESGRHLPGHAFPELLCSEHWPEPAQAQLVSTFHDWNAALLLAHGNLSPPTRARLEAAAARRPQKLLETYRMLPRVLDSSRMSASLVAARLMRGHCPR